MNHDMYRRPSRSRLCARVGLMLTIGILGLLGIIGSAATGNVLLLPIGLGLISVGTCGPFAELHRYRSG